MFFLIKISSVKTYTKPFNASAKWQNIVSLSRHPLTYTYRFILTALQLPHPTMFSILNEWQKKKILLFLHVLIEKNITYSSHLAVSGERASPLL